MSIVRMAMIPGYVYPTQSVLRPARKTGGANHLRQPRVTGRQNRFDWRRLVVEAYPVIGLAVIVGYVLWVLFLGAHTLPWNAELLPAE